MQNCIPSLNYLYVYCKYFYPFKLQPGGCLTPVFQEKKVRQIDLMDAFIISGGYRINGYDLFRKGRALMINGVNFYFIQLSICK
jgi:hypothetical protein